MHKRTVFILSGSSDIGRALMERYLASGARVFATYRKAGAVAGFEGRSDVDLLPLDLDRPEDFAGIAQYMRQREIAWDLFIASNGSMEPIGRFFEVDGAEWQRSILANALAPLELLKALYPLRRPGRINDVAFFAGGGTNNPFRNYSAYCLSKILLIKMCELLDDEVGDLNAFILGPGYVKTKIHEETLRASEAAGANYEKTLRFLETSGSSMDDIFACIEWCVHQGRDVVGGRNLSVVHDPWRGGGEQLANILKREPDRYKLRRSGNT